MRSLLASRRLICAVLSLSTAGTTSGCQPAIERSDQSQSVHEDRRDDAVSAAGVVSGGRVDTTPPCDAWRLFTAGGDAILAFRHPSGELLGGLAGSADALSAGPAGALFAAGEEGVIAWTEEGDGFVSVAHPATAVAYDPHLDRLYAGLTGGLVIAVDAPLGANPTGAFVTFAAADALAVGAQGHLFVAEGAEVLRIAAGEPIVSFTSPSWGPIAGLAIGVDGSLYLVDGGDTVFVVDNPELVSGTLEPGKRVEVETAGAAIEAILVAPDGIAYLADPGAGAVHALEEISDAYPFAPPTATWSPVEAPAALALLPPCSSPP